MRRRRFLQALAVTPAVPAVVAQQPATPRTDAGAPAQPGGRGGRGGGTGNPAILEVTPPDAVSEPVGGFFTPPQFSALRRLSGLIEPSGKGRLGALDCGVPEFLDFLIGVSPADRQQLYRGGLDYLNAQARKQFNRPFADLDDKQCHTLMEPLLVAVPWVTDPPKDPLKHFLFAVRQDVPQATQNSPEFAAASAGGGRRGFGGGGSVWNPIDPVYRG